MSFEDDLTGGHPNSLGRTVEVVERVLAAPQRLAELYACYQSDDAVVRLRTSNALRRIVRVHPEMLAPYIDRLITEIGALDQASAQWSLADLFVALDPHMTDAQRSGARAIVRRNLAEHTDWIVLARSMEALAGWAASDADLAQWLVPHLARLTDDPRKSVSAKARKLAQSLPR